MVKFQLIAIFSSYSEDSGKGRERTVGSFAFLTVERVVNMAAAFAWEGAVVSAVGGVGARGPAAPQARRPAVDSWSRHWPWWRRHKAPRRRRSRREGPVREEKAGRRRRVREGAAEGHDAGKLDRLPLRGRRRRHPGRPAGLRGRRGRRVPIRALIPVCFPHILLVGRRQILNYFHWIIPTVILVVELLHRFQPKLKMSVAGELLAYLRDNTFGPLRHELLVGARATARILLVELFKQSALVLAVRALVERRRRLVGTPGNTRLNAVRREQQLSM